MKVLTLIDRDTGRAHTTVVDRMNQVTVAAILNANVAKEARLMTDESPCTRR